MEEVPVSRETKERLEGLGLGKDHDQVVARLLDLYEEASGRSSNQG
jgi:hypothetical protein